MDDAAEDPMIIVLGFIAAAGFGSGLPLLGLIGLLACAGHLTAKIDPESLPARLFASGQRYAGQLTDTAREHMPTRPEQPQVTTQNIFERLSDRHLLIVGHTGGGKSTLLHELARRTGNAGADVLVIDIDSMAGRYPGYRVVGSGDDYNAVLSGLVIVKRELQKRREARREGVRQFHRMILLIDETQDVVREVDPAWPIVEDVIRRGRKVNIWAVIATQDSQVSTLSLAGKSHLLGNLTRVDVQQRGEQRVAVVDKSVYPLPVLRSPDDFVIAARPVQTSPASSDHQSDALLAGLLNRGLPQSEGTDRQSSEESRDHHQTSPDQSAIIAAYQRLGTKNKVWEWLRNEHDIRSKGNAYKLIDEALEQRSE
jgi:energy-coupling factor transporter ATP-binding protein EcfA2